MTGAQPGTPYETRDQTLQCPSAFFILKRQDYFRSRLLKRQGARRFYVDQTRDVKAKMRSEWFARFANPKFGNRAEEFRHNAPQREIIKIAAISFGCLVFRKLRGKLRKIGAARQICCDRFDRTSLRFDHFGRMSVRRRKKNMTGAKVQRLNKRIAMRLTKLVALVIRNIYHRSGNFIVDPTQIASLLLDLCAQTNRPKPV